MALLRFTRAASAVLDANGDGQAEISPDGGHWRITTTSVRVSTHTRQPEANLYKGSVSDTGWIEGSSSGWRDTSDTTHLLAPGERLIATWHGGDPGAVATLRVEGWQGTESDLAG